MTKKRKAEYGFFVPLPEGTPDVDGSIIGKNGFLECEEDNRINIAYSQRLIPNGSKELEVEIHGFVGGEYDRVGGIPRYRVDRVSEPEQKQNRSYLEKSLRERKILGKVRFL